MADHIETHNAVAEAGVRRKLDRNMMPLFFILCKHETTFRFRLSIQHSTPVGSIFQARQLTGNFESQICSLS